MLGGFKDAAIKQGMAVLERELSAGVEKKIDLFKSLTPADVLDDDKYSAVAVEPLWLYVRLQSGGAISAVEKLTDLGIEARFRKAMFHVRDELLKVEDGKLVLDPAFQSKVGPAIVEALRA